MRGKHVPDRALDDFRQGIAELQLGDTVVGHLATVVESFRGLGGRQERVWLLITWSDGRRERIEEDYPPWTAVEEIRSGSLRRTLDGQEVQLRVAWLRDEEARAAWRRYGIHKQIGDYL